MLLLLRRWRPQWRPHCPRRLPPIQEEVEVVPVPRPLRQQPKVAVNPAPNQLGWPKWRQWKRRPASPVLFVKRDPRYSHENYLGSTCTSRRCLSPMTSAAGGEMLTVHFCLCRSLDCCRRLFVEPRWRRMCFSLLWTLLMGCGVPVMAPQLSLPLLLAAVMPTTDQLITPRPSPLAMRSIALVTLKPARPTGITPRPRKANGKARRFVIRALPAMQSSRLLHQGAPRCH
mmetsp:Transcript_24150/g.69428  ORF Transcript_24150/g.69428 Transcript_24150/m.69428 type:complete len:229 (+) Transcript_24150:2600-3286(+)